jgi:hypothetical protein
LQVAIIITTAQGDVGDMEHVPDPRALPRHAHHQAPSSEEETAHAWLEEVMNISVLYSNMFDHNDLQKS